MKYSNKTGKKGFDQSTIFFDIVFVRSRMRNHMKRDAHNCARVIGLYTVGHLKRRPSNDTNYAINVLRVSPLVD